MNAIIRNWFILGFLIVGGCATRHPQGIVGRWTVLGTGDVVALSKAHSARLTSGGKTTTGSYRMGAPDLLILTLPGTTPAAQAQNIPYFIQPEDWASRALRRFGHQGTYEMVTNAVNQENWEVLRGLAKEGIRDNGWISLWEKNPVRVGKSMQVERDFIYNGLPCTRYSFALEFKDGKPYSHWLQVLVQEGGQSTILDFWEFGW